MKHNCSPRLAISLGCLAAVMATLNAGTRVVAWGENTAGQTAVPPGLTNIVAVAAGDSHNLALRANGRVVAWGLNLDHQCDVPEDLTNAVAVAAGGRSSHALMADGSIRSWGWAPYGVPWTAGAVTNGVGLAGGYWHALGLKADGTVLARGLNTHGQATVPPGLSNIVAVAGGEKHSLALRADGSVAAWGAALTGELEGLTNAVAIATSPAAAGVDSLALTAEGRVVVWGTVAGGQTSVPGELHRVMSMAMGRDHCLAATREGLVRAWGTNNFGQVAVPPDLSGVVAVAAGRGHSLALVGDGAPFFVQPLLDRTALQGGTTHFRAACTGLPPFLYQWRHNGTEIAGATESVLTVAQLDPSAAGTYSVVVSNPAGTAISPEARLSIEPLLISIHPRGEQVLAGADVTLSVVATGIGPLTYQWETNGMPIPGATQSTLLLPTAVPAQSADYAVRVTSRFGTVRSTSASVEVLPLTVAIDPIKQPLQPGRDATLTLSLAGSGPFSYQWQFEGQDLIGATNASLLLINPRLADSGAYRVKARNAYGEVTSAPLPLRVSPVVVWGPFDLGHKQIPVGLRDVVSIAGGGFHDLALGADGRVVAWGENTNGETNVPPDLTNAIAIAAGARHSLALKADGTVVQWGSLDIPPPPLNDVVAVSARGSASMGLRVDGTVAVWGAHKAAPAHLTGVVAIATGGEYASVALKCDGTVATWGSNAYGQQQVPPGLEAVVAIAAGHRHFLALTADGRVTAWGWNQHGQTSVPPTLDEVVAIAAGYYRSLALRADGSVVIWGDSVEPIPEGVSGIVDISAYGANLALVGDGPPWVRGPRFDRQVPIGGRIGLRADAVGGATPLRYQWMFDGRELPGETNALLALDNARPDQAGTYSVRVSNPLGTTEGDPVALHVLPLWFERQPEDQAVLLGGSASWSVEVRGAGPVSYQWHFNGVSIPDATNSVLTVSAAGFAQSGNYTVTARNPHGEVTSQAALLDVSPVVAWGSYNATPPLPAPVVPPGLGELVAIAGGDRYCLGLRPDGTVVSWGRTGIPATTVPAGLNEVIAIAAGMNHNLALRVEGTVIAWGEGREGQTTVPPGLTDVIAVAAGNYHSLAVRADGSVIGWGRNQAGQIDIPVALPEAIAVAAGGAHSLALTRDGRVVAWGFGGNGQTHVPPELAGVVAIAAAGEHNLALRVDGTVAAWGSNASGQCSVPPGLSNVIAIAAGPVHSLALCRDGTVVAWGRKSAPEITVPADLHNAVAIAAGNGHSLALLGDRRPFLTIPPVHRTAPLGGTIRIQAAGTEAWPWSYQWLVDGVPLAGQTNPALVLTGLDWPHGGSYSLVASDGLDSFTSSPTHLQVLPLRIVRPPASQRTFPGATVRLQVEVEGQGPFDFRWQFEGADLPGATNAWLDLENVAWTSAGRYAVVVSNPHGTQTSTGAVLSVSPLVGWGNNDFGQIRAPLDLTNVIALAAGYEHSLALQADGTVRAWGSNGSGQSSVPSGLSQVVAISAGQSHSLALRTDGTVVAWGSNQQGQTGVPAALREVVAIAAGGNGSVALRADGTLVGWGEATNLPALSQPAVAVSAAWNRGAVLLRDGAVISWGTYRHNGTNAPVVTPPGLSNVVSLATSVGILALRHDGVVVSWGMVTNFFAGQTDLGDIAGGDGHGLALRRDGTVGAWGNNPYGQTNVPPGLHSVGLVAAGGHHSLAWVGRPPAGPTLAGPSPDEASSGISFFATRGRRYLLEIAESLSPPSWSMATAAPVAGAGQVVTFADLESGATTRFYRVRVQ